MYDIMYTYMFIFLETTDRSTPERLMKLMSTKVDMSVCVYTSNSRIF